MSVQVAAINLSAATVGTAGAIPFGQVVPPPTIAQQMRPQQATATLIVFNESGCWLTCLFPVSRETFTIPAGAWRKLYPPPGEQELAYVVGNVVGGAPASTLYADYYLPGEPVDDLGILGNSPIGVTGAVNTNSGSAGTSFIKNDANAPGTSIIESTPSDQGSSATSINNDGSGFWQVLSANVLRKVVNVVRGTAGAVKAAITIGDSGDPSITTVYGSLQGGQPANVGALTSGAVTCGAITGTGANSLDGGALTTDGSGNLTKAGGAIFGGIVKNTNGDFFRVCSLFSGSGSGTFNHGLSTTPHGIIVCPNTGVDSSYTVGVDHITSTNCHVNIGGDAAVAWFGVAFG